MDSPAPPLPHLQPNCSQMWISFFESLSKGSLSVLEYEYTTHYEKTWDFFVFNLRYVETES